MSNVWLADGRSIYHANCPSIADNVVRDDGQRIRVSYSAPEGGVNMWAISPERFRKLIPRRSEHNG